ncbi:hypothetical protein, partial [Hominenteromicrobium sp.]|uniref:hypothetical protein n=1 Tax=Hominenteromicrobium sp. TaxID=3073581 RepID=UPI003A94E822
MMMLGFVATLTDTAVQMNLCYELSLNFLLKNITCAYVFFGNILHLHDIMYRRVCQYIFKNC